MASLLADGFDLDANERLSRAQLEALQIERMKASLAAAYSGNSAYRRAFDEAGVTPDDLRSLADLARFPFTTKADLRAAYPFGFFAVPMERVARVHASSGTTGQPTVVRSTAEDTRAEEGSVGQEV